MWVSHIPKVQTGNNSSTWQLQCTIGRIKSYFPKVSCFEIDAWSEVEYALVYQIGHELINDFAIGITILFSAVAIAASTSCTDMTTKRMLTKKRKVYTAWYRATNILGADDDG